ncbi:MAG: hypothetical protein WDO24_05775 [Pseudomonadota bacterium]
MKRLGTLAREATAYHEAGHAMMAFLEDVRVKRISIKPNAESTGRVLHAEVMRRSDSDMVRYGAGESVAKGWRARLRIESLVRICLAGPIAQRTFNPRTWRAHHGASDHDLAIRALELLASSDRQIKAYQHLLVVQVEEAVMMPMRWSCVQALAAALLENEELVCDEAVSIIRADISCQMVRRV